MSIVSVKRIEIHQLEGLDTRRRVFNRNVEITRTDSGYVGTIPYEGETYSSDPRPTIKEALNDLVQRLVGKGFSELRSRVNFRGKRYLAEREPWVQYGEPAP